MKKYTLETSLTEGAQKIVLFIEPAEFASVTPSKIGNIFINRFSISEDTHHEILKIFYLEQEGLDLF